VNSDVRNLVALQDVEQKIAGLQKQISEIPASVQRLQSDLKQMRDAHQKRVTHGQELAKNRRTFEGAVEMLRTKLSRFKDQLMSVKTNKEYTAMLHEIQGAEEQIRAEEDKILEIMEESETLEKQLKAEERELNARGAEIQAAIRALEDSAPGFEREVAKLQLERAAMEAGVGEELLGRYRRLAEMRRGVALAEARDELCTACHVRIRPQVYADLLRTEDVLACDSCSRILFLRSAL